MPSPALDLRLPAAPAFRPDPYPLLAQLRESSPLPLLDGMLVVVGRHRDCAALLRHPNASSERNRPLLALPRGPRRGLSFLTTDQPATPRLRRLLSAAFTPRMIASLSPRIAEVSDDLFALNTAKGRMDI